MDPKRNMNWHLNHLAWGFVGFALRIFLIFAAIWAGYLILQHMGPKWFFVFFFAAVAARLHFDLAWIEKNHPEEQDGQPQERENPFRKR